MANARLNDWKQAFGAIWGSANTTVAAPGVPATPVAGTAYRDTTADSNPSADPGYLTGFPFLSKSPSQIANQVLFNLSSALDDLQTHGTIGWESNTAYPVGAICHGSDNLPYACVVANTGQDPIITTGYWQLMPPSPISGPFSTTRDVVNNIPLFGLVIKQGFTANPLTEGIKAVSFGTNFPNACLAVFMQCTNPDQSATGAHDYWTQLAGPPTVSGFSFFLQNATQNSGKGDNYWIAIGY